MNRTENEYLNHIKMKWAM